MDAQRKAALLEAVGAAEEQGLSLGWIAQVLKIQQRRLRRWKHNATTPTGLVDGKPGAVVNAITPSEVAAILDGFEEIGRAHV